MSSMDNNDVYIITQERKFIAVFSKEEIADEFMDLYSDENFRKDLWTLNGFRSYKPPIGKDVYCVKISKDGSQIESDVKPRNYYNIMLIGHISFDPYEHMIINMWAKDFSDAEEYVKCLRSLVLTANEWGVEREVEI